MDRQFSIVFQAEPEGGFTAVVPSLPGCVTYGKTLKKAQEMVEEAVEAYLESMEKHGEKIPSDGPIFVSAIRIRKSGKRLKAYAS
jgi:antitoxin HicB